MKSAVSDITPIWPFLAYGAIVVILISIILGLSYVLGQRHKDRATGEAYESGIISTGSARLRFPSQFYLVAMLFVIFDVETVFMFPWAVIFNKLLLFGLIEMLVFIFILVVGYYYAWQKGALEWA